MHASAQEQPPSPGGDEIPTLTRRRDAAAVLFLGLAVLLTWLPEVSGSRSFFLFDISSLNLPARDWGFRQIRQGWFPQWCPHWGVGFPFVAESQSGICYPPNYLFFLASPGWYATTIAYVAHLWWAGVGCYFLFRNWASPSGSLLGALVFELGGRLLEHQIHAAVVEAIAWMPWVILGLESFLTAGRGRALILASGAAGLQLLAGSIPMCLCCWCGCAGWLLGHGLLVPGSWRRVLLAGCVVGAFALGLSSVLLFPATELLLQSVRSEGIAGASAAYGTVPLHRWAAFVVPTLFGHPGYATAWLEDREPIYEMGLYHGLFAIPLAILGLTALRRRTYAIWAFSILAASGLCLAAGELNALGWILRRLPVFSGIRIPARFLALTGLGICGLAAIGWDELQGGAGGALRRLLAALACSLAFVAAVGVYLYLPVFWPPSDEGPASKWNEVLRSPLPGHMKTMLSATLPWSAGVLVAGLVALLAAGRWKTASSALMLAVMGVDLGHHARDWYPSIEPEYHAETEAAREIKRRINPPRVLVHWRVNNLRQVRVGQQGYNLGREHIDRVGECLYYERGPLFDVGVLSDEGHLPLTTRRMHDFRARLVDSPWFAALCGIQLEMWPVLPRGEVEYAGRQCFLQQSPNPAPFAYLCPGVQWCENGSALDQLTANPTDPRKRVVVEGDDPGVAQPGASFRECRAKWQGPNRLEVEVDAPVEAFLVVNELWDRNWSAILAGKERPILTANHLFMAIKVPSGRSQLILTYSSRWMQIGSQVALATLLVWSAALVFWQWSLRSDPAKIRSSGVWLVGMAVVGSFALGVGISPASWLAAFPNLLAAW